MGLFSGSKKTYVGTSVSRAITDDLIPNSIKQATINALHTDSDVLPTITDYLTKSIGVRAEKMYKYGESKYVYGLPSGEFISANIAPRIIEEILRAKFNDPLITVSYSRFGQLNLHHLAWKALVETYQYNSSDQTLKIPGTHKWPVLLDDLQVIVPKSDMQSGHFSPEALEMWEEPPHYRRSQLGELAISTNYFPIYSWSEQPKLGAYAMWLYDFPEDDGMGFKEPVSQPDEKVRLISLPLANYDFEGDYFQAKYIKDGKSHYWEYKYGSGEFPELDGYFSNPDHLKLFGEFYPFIYFRTAKTSVASNKSSETYKSSKKICSILGMDYDTVHDAVHENPDINDIEQAFLYFGVPGISEDPLENRYLFEFFDKLYYTQDNQYQRPEEAAMQEHWRWYGNTRLSEGNAIVIQDRLFKMTFLNRGIFKQRRAGTIGAKGTYTSKTKVTPVRFMGQNDDYGNPTTVEQGIREHVYCKQVGTGIYEEIRVINLGMKYHVSGGSLFTLGEFEDPILLVPLEKSIMDSFNIPDKEHLFSKALHYVFNSKITVKTKWYQTGLFQFIVMVVAIVISILTWNPAPAAAAAGALVTAMIAIGTFLIKSLILSLVFKLVVNVLGVEFAIVFAVVLAAYGMYEGLSEGGLANAPWAKELLNASVGLVKAAGESIQEAIKLIHEESTDFLKEAKEQMKLLDEANDLLKPTSILSPFVYLGESTEAFYNRTIHAGNVGLMSIEAQSLFVDQALRLPTIQDTIRSDDYAI